MRIAILFSLLICTHAFAAPDSDHHEKNFAAATAVEKSDAGAVYGARLPASMPAAVDLDSAASNVEAHAGKLAAFSGRITEVCQKMGCWVVLTSEHGQFARVSMHDHAFGVPKDANGPAIVYGTLTRKNLSAEEMEHLKKDGADLTQPTELQIDALSVIIPDSV